MAATVVRPAGIPVPPKNKPRPKPPAPKQGTSKKKTSSGGGGDPYKKERDRQRKAANNDARRQAREDLRRLNLEIKAAKEKRAYNRDRSAALKRLLNGGLERVALENVRSIDKALATKMGQITATFDAAMKDFNADLRENENAEADSTFANLANRSRERGDLISQALSQGAGETDVLRAQQQALRNWSANQADVNRSFFDTRNSINSAISDLNTSTKTSMINEEQSANSAKAQTWNEYFKQMADTADKIGEIESNLDLLDLEILGIKNQKDIAKDILNWLKAGKNIEDYKGPKVSDAPKADEKKSDTDWAKIASEWLSKTWKDPGVSKSTQNWTGGKQSTGTLNTSRQFNLGTSAAPRPEGATLRRW